MTAVAVEYVSIMTNIHAAFPLFTYMAHKLLSTVHGTKGVIREMLLKAMVVEAEATFAAKKDVKK